MSEWFTTGIEIGAGVVGFFLAIGLAALVVWLIVAGAANAAVFVSDRFKR